MPRSVPLAPSPTNPTSRRTSHQHTRNSGEPVELTILMPCLNEAGTLASCVTDAFAFLRRAGVVGEVLIADNGSKDGSRQIARNLGARVALVTKRGYGAALLGGLSCAQGKYVIMADADDSYDFLELDAMLARLRTGSQLVMGNRFQGQNIPGAMPFLNRHLGNPVLSAIGRLLFPCPIRDFHCGLRGFERDAINRIGMRASGMEFASEMVLKAVVNKLVLAEVPVTLRPDGRNRPPHLRPWRDGWRHLRFMVQFRLTGATR